MPPLMYSHRLKSVLLHTLRELRLVLRTTDQSSDLSLAENELMIRETIVFQGIEN